MYERIPNELKQLKQWVCWKWVDDGEKRRKVPVNAVTGGNAQSNNPDTWTDFETAKLASECFSGIGFMFANGYFGVDIDGEEAAIVDYKNGKTDNIIAEFVHTLCSYAEYSVSGKGLHVICRGSLPDGGRRKNNVEMYSSGRFFIMTGDAASDFTEIADCTESIKFLHEKYIGAPDPAGKYAPKASTAELEMSDAEVVEAALKSKQGNAFGSLYNGQWDVIFNSQSEADLSFCNMLAFWCRKDAVQMDRIFRASGLMRDKWDRKQAGSTYGQITINKALNICKTVYTKSSAYAASLSTSDDIKKPPTPHTFDDTGNAARLLDNFGDSIRYNYVAKRWMYYDGRRWLEDYDGASKRMVDATLEMMPQEGQHYIKDEDIAEAFNKHIKTSRSSRAKTAMLKEAEHYVPILPEQLDKHNDLLNTPCGIINLRTGELMPHDRKLYLSFLTNSEISDTMEAPLWMGFLDTIFNGDRELIRFIQKAVGYSLSGSIREQCVFFLYGDGNNGKSTFLNVISDILGSYAINIQPATLMAKHASYGSTSDIARLKGARFVTSAEPNEGMRLDEGLLKQLTGGDRITASKKYENEFEFHTEFKLWMSMNHRPIIRGTDNGIWRRIRLIPFTASIPPEKIDKLLLYKLRKEAPAIFRWALEGCLMWQKEGLTPPESVEVSTREYRTSMDVITNFVSQCCITGSGEEAAKTLFDAYRKWAEDNNEFVMTATRFGLEMSKRYDKIRQGSGYVYRNIRLIESFKPYQVYLKSS